MSRRVDPRRRTSGDLFAVEVSGRGSTLTIGARVSEFFAMEMTDEESVEAERLAKELLKVLGGVVIRVSNREVGTTFDVSKGVFRETFIHPQPGHPFPDREL